MRYDVAVARSLGRTPSPVRFRSGVRRARIRRRGGSPYSAERSLLARELDDLADRRRHVHVVDLEMGKGACKHSDSVDEVKAGVHDHERCATHPAQPALSLQELAAKSLGTNNDAHPRREELELNQESHRGHTNGPLRQRVSSSESHIVKHKKKPTLRATCVNVEPRCLRAGKTVAERLRTQRADASGAGGAE